MLFTTLTTLLLLTSSLGAPTTPAYGLGQAFDYPKSDAEILASKRMLSNGERIARGLTPAWPAAVAAAAPRRARNSIKKKNSLAPRASPVPCAATAPAQVNPISFLFGSDDAAVAVTLPFNIIIFGESSNILTLTTNGIYRLGSNANTFARYQNAALPQASEGTAVMAYWDDLITNRQVPAGETDSLTYEATATTLNIRHKGEQFGNNLARIDFTVFYTTANPGVFTVYIDRSDGNGIGATVGAQGTTAVSPQIFTQFSSDTESLPAGTVITINTNGAGSTSSFTRCPV